MKSKKEVQMYDFLELKKLSGRIKDFTYEGMTLRIGPRRFTPDFMVEELPAPDVDEVFGCHTPITLIEVKAKYKWEDAMVKYDLFKERFKHLFNFEMHEHTREYGWRKIR